jgi:hypothetical protein
MRSTISQNPFEKALLSFERDDGAILRCEQVNPLGIKNDVLKDAEAIATAVCKLEGSV